MNKCVLPLLLFAAGCATQTAYERGPVPVPERWPTAQKLGAGDTAPGWENLFPQPALRSLISTALNNNRDLAIAIGRVAEAAALAGYARSDRYPAVNANLQQSIMLSSPHTQTTTTSIALTSFELDFWSLLQGLDTAARQRYLASEQAAANVRLILVADVVNAYYSLIELTQRHMLARNTLESREHSLRLVRARRDLGLAGDLDVLSADAARAAASAELANLARQKAASENALRLLTGDLGANLDAAAAESFPAVASVGVPAAAVSDVLLRRPDVMAAEQRLQATHADLATARMAWLPKLSLSLASTAGKLVATPALSLPLFDASRLADNIDIGNARQKIAFADYEKTIQQAYREVADLYAAQRELAAQVTAQQDLVARQQERLKLVEARQKAGVSSYLELLDAQREEFSARQNLLAVQRQQHSTTAGLYKALGLL